MSDSARAKTDREAEWRKLLTDYCRLQEQTAGLRALLRREHRNNYRVHGFPDLDDAWKLHATEQCDVCTLLADPEGQRLMDRDDDERGLPRNPEGQR